MASVVPQSRRFDEAPTCVPGREIPHDVWYKPVMRIVVSSTLLACWLALSHALPSFFSEWGDGGGGLAGKFFRVYLKHWREVTWLGAFWCAAIWGVMPLWRAMQSPRFSDGVVGAATPGTLGAIRAWTCGILLVMTLREDLASSALLPRSMLEPQGFLKLLHLLPIGFDAFLADARLLWGFQGLTVLLLAAGVVGLGTRAAVPAAAACYLVMEGVFRGYSFFYHSGILPLYVLAVLSFTRCDQGWAVDRILRAARGKPVASAHAPTAYFGWARYAVWIVIAFPYAAAGCSKLYFMGLDWASADSMRWMLLRPTLELYKEGFNFDAALWLMPMPDVFFVLLGAVALGSELAFGLVLVSRRARLVLPAVMVCVHVAILFLQNILFLDLILLRWVFYDWGAPGRWLARRRGAVAGRCDAPVPDVAAGRLPGTHGRGALAAMTIVLFLSSLWVTKLSFYPLTPLRMFTGHKGDADAGVVSYGRAVVHYEDGGSERAAFGRWIGAVRAGRTRVIVMDAFRDAEGLEEAKRFLDAVMRAAGAGDHGARMSSVELQLWRWNFRDDPDNPDRGVRIDRYVHPAP